MENEILLLGKKIFWDKSEILLDYQPDENWQDVWDAKLGHWECKDGYLIGSEPGNFGGILLSKGEAAPLSWIRLLARNNKLLLISRDLGLNVLIISSSSIKINTSIIHYSTDFNNYIF